MSISFGEFLVLALLGTGLFSCSNKKGMIRPANLAATEETKALYRNLDEIRKEKTLFGHQDDMAYGVNWLAEDGRSDVKDVTGSYPGVFGYELGDLERDSSQNLDRVNFENMKRWIRQGHREGGLVTLSWHMDNPKTDGSSWDTTRAVDLILPGGSKHEMFKTWLDRFALFAAGLKAEDGTIIPIVFRPYHENTGGWFWWGRGHCTPEEYKALWVFTYHYLTKEKQMNQLLWAWSPAEKFRSEWDLWYPGDAYTDFIGIDDYGTWNRENAPELLSRSLGGLVEMAENHSKIPIFAETGSEGVKDSLWFTGKLLPALSLDERAGRLAWVLVWRNANGSTDRLNHFYAPFPGHPAAEDFIRFRKSPRIAFAGDVALYR